MNPNGDKRVIVKTLRINQRIDPSPKNRLVEAAQSCGISRAKFVRVVLENHLVVRVLHKMTQQLCTVEPLSRKGDSQKMKRKTLSAVA